ARGARRFPITALTSSRPPQAPRALHFDLRRRGLRRSPVFLVRDFLQQVNDSLIRGACFRVKRGEMLRKSVGSNVVFVSILPVRKPAPRGLNGTKPMPSSSHVASTPFCSTSRVYS